MRVVRRHFTAVSGGASAVPQTSVTSIRHCYRDRNCSPQLLGRGRLRGRETYRKLALRSNVLLLLCRV